jgi:protein TonB
VTQLYTSIAKTPVWKRSLALFSALSVPFLTFWLVLTLNEHGGQNKSEVKKSVSFDVEKKKQLKKAPPKKPEPKQRPKTPQRAPSLKPGLSNDALGMEGLSFGVPQFSESDFSQFDSSSLLDDGSEGRDKEQTVDTKPKVLKRSPIVYPEMARKQGISGYVIMNVLINENGNVEEVVIVESKPEEMFDLKAESTIRQWRFDAATYNGRKVKAWAMQKIVFKLN